VNKLNKSSRKADWAILQLVLTDGCLVTSHLKKLKSYYMLTRALDLGRFFDCYILRFTDLLSLLNKGELPPQWKESIIEQYYCYQLHTKFHQILFSKG
jgi:hypothetical protein